ncbi:MAG: hypothetical protein KUG79_19400 [Pseudomonadales bacterium]|nr:hypothetical protein [Pseudomonadales bacterium]
MIKKWLSMGPLRVMLHGLAILFMLVLPFSEPSWNPQGIEILFGAVVPAVAPMVIIIIMLDVLMSKIWQSDTSDPVMKQHYQSIIWTHLVFAALLLLLWLEAFSQALF